MNSKPYTKDRKRRLTKPEADMFNRWYIINFPRLAPMSNTKLAMLFESQKGIQISRKTVELNRSRWTVNESNQLERIR